MTILFTIISRLVDATILVEVADNDIKGGNLSQIFIQMLQYFRDHNNATTTTTDNNIIFNNNERKTFVQRNNTNNNTYCNGSEIDILSYFVDACTNVWPTAPTDANNTTATTTSNTSVVVDDTNDYNRLEYEPDEYYIHVFLKDGVFYICLADDPDPRDQKVSFAYLDALQKDFIRMFRTRRIMNARSHGLNNEFTPTVRSLVHYYNINHNKIRTDTKVRVMMSQVNDMKSIMGKNMKLLINRSYDVNHLATKSSELEEKVQVFKKRARQNLRIQQRIYYSKSIFLCLLIVFCIYIGISIPCGLTFRRCYVKVNNNRRLRYVVRDITKTNQT